MEPVKVTTAIIAAALAAKLSTLPEESEGHTHFEIEVPQLKQFVGSGVFQVTGSLSVTSQGEIPKMTFIINNSIKDENLDVTNGEGGGLANTSSQY